MKNTTEYQNIHGNRTYKASLFHMIFKEKKELLSDAFLTDGGCLECEAVMLNINYGHNRELMEKCRPLAEYTEFIAAVRRYARDPELSLSDAIDLAINECIEKGILKDILIKQRGEVHMSILETFDQELYERDLKELAAAKGRQEGLKEGLQQGLEKGLERARIDIIQKKLAKGKSIEEIADALEISVEEVQKLIELMK